MVVDDVSEEQIDRLFQALADSTRRDIVRRTMVADYSVSALARCYSTSFAAIQKHVAVLERAELVTKQRSGRQQLVTSNVATIRTAHQLLDQFEAMWRDRIDRFGNELTIPGDRKPEHHPSRTGDQP